MENTLNLTQLSIQLVYNFYNNTKLEEETITNIDQIVAQISLITFFILQMLLLNPELNFNLNFWQLNMFIWFVTELQYQICERCYIYKGVSFSWRPYTMKIQNFIQDIIALVIIQDTNVYQNAFFEEFGLIQLILLFLVLITTIDTTLIILEVYQCCKKDKSYNKYTSKGGLKYYFYGSTVGDLTALFLYVYIYIYNYSNFNDDERTWFWLYVSSIIALGLFSYMQYCWFQDRDDPNATFTKKFYSLVLGYSTGLLNFYSASCWIALYILCCKIYCDSQNQIYPINQLQIDIDLQRMNLQTNILQRSISQEQSQSHIIQSNEGLSNNFKNDELPNKFKRRLILKMQQAQVRIRQRENNKLKKNIYDDIL